MQTALTFIYNSILSNVSLCRRATPGSRSAQRALRLVRGLSMLLPGRIQWTGYTSLAVGMAAVGAPDPQRDATLRLLG